MGEVIDLTRHLRERAHRVAARRARRNQRGQFEPIYTVAQLLEILKLVAEHAQRTQRKKDGKLRFAHPWDVTERAWEQAADEVEPKLGWVPKPNGIVEHLRRQTGRQWSWGVWLRRAFDITDDDKFAESLTRRPERDTTLGDAFRSMLLVMAKLGHAPVSKPTTTPAIARSAKGRQRRIASTTRSSKSSTAIGYSPSAAPGTRPER